MGIFTRPCRPDTLITRRSALQATTLMALLSISRRQSKSAQICAQQTHDALALNTSMTTEVWTISGSHRIANSTRALISLGATVHTTIWIFTRSRLQRQHDRSVDWARSSFAGEQEANSLLFVATAYAGLCCILASFFSGSVWCSGYLFGCSAGTLLPLYSLIDKADYSG